MPYFILLKSAVHRRLAQFMVLALLFTILFSSLAISFALNASTSSALSKELDRLGYGDTTAWIESKQSERVAKSIKNSPLVQEVRTQPLIFSGYKINGKHSDNEGQILPYEPERYAYEFVEELPDHSIVQGTIYISPALASTYKAKIGDTIEFNFHRDTPPLTFTIAGFFQDPFMGSSMIDMKSFLINASDFFLLQTQIKSADQFTLLAKNGAMLHITKNSGTNPRELSQTLSAIPELSSALVFMYSKETISHFMLLLARIFSGFLAAFSALLLFATLIILSHSISSFLQEDAANIGSLKVAGLSASFLRFLTASTYFLPVLFALALSAFATHFLVLHLPNLLLNSIGLLLPVRVPPLLCALAFALVCSVYIFVAFAKTSSIAKITPVRLFNYEGESLAGNFALRARCEYPLVSQTINPHFLQLSLAVRKIVFAKRRYRGLFFISLILVFFLSTILRMNAWLGKNGEGLMNSFSVADHDIAFQPLASIEMSEIESIVTKYGEILDSYDVAMQSVWIDGLDVTANAVDKPQVFHILQGRTCSSNDEVLLTKMLSVELQKSVGDTVTISQGGKSAQFTVTGIYQCANGMGKNIGLSKEGYAKIASNADGFIWCRHWIYKGASDLERNEVALKELQETFPMEGDAHTNSWSGLEGIVQSLHLIVLAMLVLVAVFVALCVSLTISHFIFAEKKDTARLLSLGFTPTALRASFAIRFAIVSFCGGIVAMLLSTIFSDRIVAILLQPFGIGEFSVASGIFVFISPVFVMLLFAIASFAFSSKIKKTDLPRLLGGE